MYQVIKWILGVVLLHVSIFAVGQCDQTTYKALRDFYIATNGDEWYNNNGWDVDSPNVPRNCDFSRWHGLTIENGRVTKINMSDNNLEGELPLSFYDLTDLEIINLNFNELRGSLSERIGRLKRLRGVVINSNLLRGALPSELAQLNRLRYFHAQGNQLSGELPSIVGMDNLSSLILNDNKITGFIPDSYNRLERLHLKKNLLSGCHSTVLRSLCGKDVNVGGNYFTQSWASFCRGEICSARKHEVTYDTLSISRCSDKKTFIFLPDGYVEEEYNDFLEFAKSTIVDFQKHMPYVTFEILAARTYSNESGVSHPGVCNNEVGPSDCAHIPIKIVDNYFGTNLDGIDDLCGDVERECHFDRHL